MVVAGISLQRAKEALDKFTELADETKEINVTTDLSGVVGDTQIAVSYLSDIGREKIERVAEFIDSRTEFVDPDSPSYLGGIGTGIPKVIGPDYIECSIKALRTYITIKEYQEKIKELNKLKNIEKILGE